ncbi:hypothetical protein AMS68_000294 [Peltaster fructicola]|uniref:Annexin n=1 Tax=Peltaster fructicola TaxID=286661 RepID=A0A6H0XJ73_9PEZI|nr:hypothetical protein AMS68_000294 [Peltaster fructicola]
MSYYGGPPPPGQYGGPPPPQQGYGAPQQPYGAGPQAPYGSHHGHHAPPPPPGQYGAPPPGPYGQPPTGQYGPPPGQYGHPQGQYGAAQGQYQPPQPYAAPSQGPAAPPSPGYIPGQTAQYDMTPAADQLRSAMKGFGTDEKALIAVLAPMDALQIAGVKQAFQARHRRDLMKDVRSETGGYFKEALEAVIRGPLEQDCFTIHEAIRGMGTKETALNDTLLGRSNADMNAIKMHYRQMFGRTLEQDVKGDLSMKTERLFEMVMAARRTEESVPVNHQQVEADVNEIYRATEGKVGSDALLVCSVFSSRSDAQLRAISQVYFDRYRKSLAEVIKKEFSGHMEEALLFILRNAEDRAHHDAELFEEAMKGMGTKESMLIRRIVMIHWDRNRMHQAKGAYHHYYKQELVHRVRGETSGDYGRFLEALVGL